MKTNSRFWWQCCTVFLVLSAPLRVDAAELMITQVSDLTIAYDSSRDELILGALQRLWALPAAGGEARALTPIGLGLTQPAVSPDGRYIVAVGGWQRGKNHLWLVDRDTGAVEQLTRGGWQDTSPAWQPDSRGLVFSSNRGGHFQLWSKALGTDGAIALTRGRDNDSDPVLDESGNVHFVRQTGDRWMLMQLSASGRQITRHISPHRLSQPTIRRDGILTTVMRHRPDGRTVLDALLPRQEMLVKTLTQDTAAIEHPPVWLDRDRYVTVSRGRLVVRRPATRGQKTLPFTIWVSTNDPQPAVAATTSGSATADHSPWILRGARIYDPVTNALISGTDIVIADGLISALTRPENSPEGTIIDLGDVVVLPGLIDIDARVTTGNAAHWLASGVTSISTLSRRDSANVLHDYAPRQIDLKLPDFRALTDNRDRLQRLVDSQSGRFITDQLLPDLTLGQALLDASWFERNTISSYEDEQLLLNRSGTMVTSHMVERGQLTKTRLESLSRSRLWKDATRDKPRIAATKPANATAYGHLLVAASGNSHLPPGISLIAELLGMYDAGVPMHQVIASATHRSAAVIGRPDLGHIAVGARADLLILPGDPRVQPLDLLSPVGIVTNGRFYSIPTLLEPQ